MRQECMPAYALSMLQTKAITFSAKYFHGRQSQNLRLNSSEYHFIAPIYTLMSISLITYTIIENISRKYSCRVLR